MEPLLQDLPNELLLEVFRHLESRDLLALRLQCRRLRDLALHPHLWRGRWVSSTEPAVCAAVLRVVPCLEELEVGDDALAELAASTECAVRILCLELGANCFAAALLRQVALGRMRCLAVKLNACEVFSAIVNAVQASSLEEVMVLDHDARTDVFAPDGPTQPSLKVLKYEAHHMSYSCPRVDFLLETQAATLKVVKLGFNTLPSSVLLGGLHNLSDLECSILENMRPLLQCRQLTRLRLEMNRLNDEMLDPIQPQMVAAAADFLRGATQLQDVELEATSVSSETVRMLTEALAFSGRAAVRSLAIEDRCFGNEHWDDVSMAALAGLRHLRVLQLRGTPPDVLLFARVRSLTELRVEVTSGCVHEWLHLNGLDLVARKPRLHVVLKTPGIVDWRAECKWLCQFCALGCHWKGESALCSSFGFFGHSGSADEVHSALDGVLWVRA